MTITSASSNISFLERSIQANPDHSFITVAIEDSVTKIISLLDSTPLIKRFDRHISPPNSNNAIALSITPLLPSKPAAIVAGKIALYLLVSGGCIAISGLLLDSFLSLVAVRRPQPFLIILLNLSKLGLVTGTFFSLLLPLLYSLTYSSAKEATPFHLFGLTPFNMRDCKLYLLHTVAWPLSGAVILTTGPLSIPILGLLNRKFKVF